jgi:arsenite methyltransferase
MMDSKDLKLVVREKYNQIAQNSNLKLQTSCCGASGCCEEFGFSMIGDAYSNIQGHVSDADLGLGCGIPTEFANIIPGNSILDLGSGAGNDCFVARAIVGETGKVTGLDFSEEMLAKANENTKKLGYKNVRFVKGDIEEMPLESKQFDVVISNCVLNLVPEKNKAFSEIFRVLKPGGHFCLSDVVLKGELPEKLRADAEMYAGCVSGALQMDEYLALAEKNGFRDIKIHKERKIDIPASILGKYLSEMEMNDVTSGNIGIFSITLSAAK